MLCLERVISACKLESLQQHCCSQGKKIRRKGKGMLGWLSILHGYLGIDAAACTNVHITSKKVITDLSAPKSRDCDCECQCAPEQSLAIVLLK